MKDKKQKFETNDDNKIEIERLDKRSNKTVEPDTENKDQAISGVNEIQGNVIKEIEAKLEEALNRISELEDINKDLNERLLRRAAEFENYKRRTENDQLNFIKYAAENFIKKIIPVYNDLQRSLQHTEKSNNGKSLAEGLKLVFDKFSKVLEEQGVKKIETVGKEFDFNLHEALLQQQAPGVEANTVIEEVEPGYIYKDKVLIHAKVIVNTGHADADTSGSEKAEEGK